MLYISCYFHTSYILREFYNQHSKYNSLAKIRDVTVADYLAPHHWLLKAAVLERGYQDPIWQFPDPVSGKNTYKKPPFTKILPRLPQNTQNTYPKPFRAIWIKFGNKIGERKTFNNIKEFLLQKFCNFLSFCSLFLL